MKSIFKILALSITLVLLNCNNENSKLVYKYSNMPEGITCETPNKKLYLEALYAFEQDILNFYGKNNRRSDAQPNLTYAYGQFVRKAVNGQVPYESVVSKHAYDVFKALKKDNTLWDDTNTKSNLNYASPAIICISENLKDANLKTTFNALLSVNDLSPKLFGPPLLSKYRNALGDKHLASYIAFELYYSKLFGVDETQIDFDKPQPQPETQIDFNKTPNANTDPHAGHNH